MKKWMTIMLLGAMTAGMAAAEDDTVPWWKKPFVKGGEETAETAQSTVSDAESTPAPSSAMQHMQRREGMGGWQRLSPEQLEKMKAEHEKLMKLGEAARNETDPAKKEELVSQLRSELNTIADRMQQVSEKRLAHAERELTKLKAQMAAAEQNREQRIEEQIKRILSGEPLHRPEGLADRPYKKGPKGPKPPSEEN